MTFVRSPKDFWAGILFIAFGVAAVTIAYNYPLGTAGRMGPGYFPRGLGFIMIGLGSILSLRALKVVGGKIQFTSFKPLLIVLGSVLIFGLVAPSLGVIFSTILLVMLSSTAAYDYRWKESIIAALVIAAFTYVTFVWALSLQLPVWPAFFR